MKKSNQNNSNQGTLYCRPELRGQPLIGKTSGKYCPTCNFKLRGPNHDEGKHHKEKENRNL